MNNLSRHLSPWRKTCIARHQNYLTVGSRSPLPKAGSASVAQDCLPSL